MANAIPAPAPAPGYTFLDNLRHVVTEGASEAARVIKSVASNEIGLAIAGGAIWSGLTHYGSNFNEVVPGNLLPSDVTPGAQTVQIAMGLGNQVLRSAVALAAVKTYNRTLITDIRELGTRIANFCELTDSTRNKFAAVYSPFQNLEDASTARKITVGAATALAGLGAVISGASVGGAFVMAATMFSLNGFIKPGPPNYLGSDLVQFGDVPGKPEDELTLGNNARVPEIGKKTPVKMRATENSGVVAATMQVTMPIIVDYIGDRIRELLSEDQLFNGDTERNVLEELRNGVNHDKSSWLAPKADHAGSAQAKTVLQRVAADNLLRALRPVNGTISNDDLNTIKVNLNELQKHGIPLEFVGKPQQENMKKLIAFIKIHQAVLRGDSLQPHQALSLREPMEAFKLLGLGDHPQSYNDGEAAEQFAKIIGKNNVFTFGNDVRIRDAENKNNSKYLVQTSRNAEYIRDFKESTEGKERADTKGNNSFYTSGYVWRETGENQETRPLAMVSRPGRVYGRQWYRTDNSQGGQGSVVRTRFANVRDIAANEGIRVLVLQNKKAP